MFYPSDDDGRWIYQLESSHPNNRDHNRVEGHCLRVQRVIVDARRSLLVAALRCRHFHLSALVLHHAATGTFFCVHLRIGDHAGDRWSQA